MKKPSYWKLVYITARELATSWPTTVPDMFVALMLAIADLIGATVALLLALVIPFTAIFAPLWVWYFERLNARDKARRDLEEATRAH